MIYVTSEIEQSVSIVDPTTKTVVASIPTGKPESHNVAVSHDGRRAYTSNVNSGTVSVLDVKARKLVTIIQVAEGSYASPLGDKDPRKDWKVQRIAVSPDDQTVFTCDWTKSQLVAISTSTNTVMGRAQLAAPCYGEAITADGKWALVPVIANQVAVVDLRQMKVARTVEMPSAPQQVLIRLDGAEAYVSCHGAQGDKEKVAFVRTSDWTVDHIVDTGYWPDGLAWSALNPDSLRPGQ